MLSHAMACMFEGARLAVRRSIGTSADVFALWQPGCLPDPDLPRFFGRCSDRPPFPSGAVHPEAHVLPPKKEIQSSGSNTQSQRKQPRCDSLAPADGRTSEVGSDRRTDDTQSRIARSSSKKLPGVAKKGDKEARMIVTMVTKDGLVSQQGGRPAPNETTIISSKA